VALTAGYYLMTKLQMREADPLPAGDLFDVDQVQVDEGLVRTARLPENQLFIWKDPAKRRDIILLIGEAQPPTGKFAFCGRLLDYAERLGVKDVFTFAAMATDMHPRAASRVVGVATHAEGRAKLREAEVEIMEEGQITGLNGVFLGAAALRGMRGIGLLGEMPAFATQVPFPKASKAVLEIFARLAGLEIDFQELEEYGQSMENQLAEVLDKLRQAIQQQQKAEAGEEETLPKADGPEAPEPERLTEEDRQRIERLFAQAGRERSKAFELKRELDRLGAFRTYENRFLDLFRKAG
jgi:hypothetical protein